MRKSKKMRHTKNKTKRSIYTDEARRIMREIKQLKSIQSTKRRTKTKTK